MSPETRKHMALAAFLAPIFIGFVLAIFLKAYSLGGGTYTGVEAVSNNANMLKEPRVRTGKWTMFLTALSLSITAGGIILLYLLWDVAPSHTGETLNAVVSGDIIDSLGLRDATSHMLLVVVLVFEGALLFVAANTGFLGGPAVLANMAVDRWALHPPPLRSRPTAYT